MSLALLHGPDEAQELADLREQAARLRALVAESVASGVGRRALLLRLSRLPEDLARPHHLRLARAAIDPIAQADRARVFRLPHGDLVAVWRGEAAHALRVSLDAVSLLFAGDEDRLPDPGVLMQTLELPAEAGVLLAAIDGAVHRDDAAGLPEPGAGEPLDPATLSALEAALVQADISRFVRRRPVCARRLEGGFRPCWEMRTLSVSELAATLVPERAVRADPWLFRRLTRSLDRRMLALLSAPQELRGAGPFGFDLNVGALLSREFIRFDAALPPALRGQVVLGLRPADIMADPGAFLFARDFARARGYRLLLRDMTPDLLELIPPERAGLDLVGLRYGPELVCHAEELPLPDPECVVLGRVETPEAVAWGRSRGIAFYQGRAALPTSG